MKFTLTISDMTPEDLTEVVTGLGYADHPLASNTPQIEIIKTQVDVEDDDDGVDAVGDLDSNGLPWDERIHSGSKKQNKDGSWKSRKGVSDEVKAEVEAELRGQVKQTLAPPQPANFAAFPRPDEVLAAPVEQPQAPAPVEQPQAPAPVEQPQAPAPVEQPQYNIQSLMKKFQELLADKKIQPNFTVELVQYLNNVFASNYQSIVEIANNQLALEAAFRYIEQKVK